MSPVQEYKYCLIVFSSVLSGRQHLAGCGDSLDQTDRDLFGANTELERTHRRADSSKLSDETAPGLRNMRPPPKKVLRLIKYPGIVYKKSSR